ncbi:nucleoside triphosphate pyrophosphohydrolase [Paenibacillus aurantius]|uniref:Nucleoside triphosphate pyrophosphohydrolase n=1 Tax=Paenibacillus aurantius TaxID=2918900 RepID=A0AA96RDS2_9BACL|nr:nucleoside triphosphate pyrophosphohydrolase [Paenibacillus aurantius]WNQ11680.1 nucleoside triphosphate pyrophosphohydrolase [Paenibacillus aurantius]
MEAKLIIVGLGTGDENQLTLGIWRRIEEAKRIYVRTEQHPVVDFLKRSGIEVHSFDPVYERHSDFASVYEEIADKLMELAAEAGDGPVLYGVPGHPMVAEQTTQLLRSRCAEQGLPLEVLGGESFLDQVFLRFGFDPIEGFQLLDAGDVQGGRLNPLLHTIIGQVYDAYTASDVKLGLMELYPDDYPVTIGHALGVPGEEVIREVPLYELDREEGYGNLSLIWVPRSEQDELQNRTFSRLHEIVAILRSPDGCPWDREQTHESIRKNLIEETYEVLETIDDDDPDAMAEELGDLLLQIMLHSQMEEETGAFTVFDVIAGLNEKLIRRHPHVFGDRTAGNAEEALANWQDIKQEEKRKKGIEVEKQSVLDGVPRDLPGLMKAYKLQKKAASVGFDWDRSEEVLAKVREELAELEAEMGEGAEPERRTEELGDLLFAVVNLARFLKVDPEEAIASCSRKFYRRFQYIEEQMRINGQKMDKTELQVMEKYWQEAKKVQ